MEVNSSLLTAIEIQETCFVRPHDATQPIDVYFMLRLDRPARTTVSFQLAGITHHQPWGNKVTVVDWSDGS